MDSSINERLTTLYERANELSGGAPAILWDALQRFGETHAAEAAAGLAYYAFFSLFPLLLAFVFIASFFLEGEQAFEETVDFVTQAIPISRGLIQRNVRQVVELRGAVGGVGLIGLLWAATGVFSVLAHNISRAWSEAEVRGFLHRRLVALGMVGVLSFLLVLSLFSAVLLNTLSRLQVPLAGGISIYGTPVWTVLVNVVPWLFTFLMFLALYRWTPNTKVEWRAALWGALVAALGWEVAKRVFTWYVNSELVQYELVYGSLGTVVALLLWIYVSSWITLFGAHLGAAICRRAK